MLTGPLEYRIRVQVRLTLDEAAALKTCADHHYDHKVKESGREGAIARLAKYATMRAEHPPRDGEDDDGFFCALSTCEIDTMMKALEQARHHDATTAEIGAALKDELREAFGRATAEWCRLSGVKTP
jgi:hypothetical protein